MLRSDRDHQFSKVTELQSLTEQLERTLEQERSKTSDLTNRLEVLVQELDSAAAAKMDIER